MQFRRQSNAVYQCDYHIVLTSKYRRKIFRAGVFEYITKKIEEVRRYHPEVVIEEINCGEDHIHMLVSIPPKMSVGSVVRKIKSNTARAIRREFGFIKEVYWGTESVWSKGYFVSTVGVNKKVIAEYIQEQGREDSGQAKLELG